MTIDHDSVTIHTTATANRDPKKRTTHSIVASVESFLFLISPKHSWRPRTLSLVCVNTHAHTKSERHMVGVTNTRTRERERTRQGTMKDEDEEHPMVTLSQLLYGSRHEEEEQPQEEEEHEETATKEDRLEKNQENLEQDDDAEEERARHEAAFWSSLSPNTTNDDHTPHTAAYIQWLQEQLVPSHSTTTAENATPIVNLADLRKTASSLGLPEGRSRAVAWRVLTGYLPVATSEWAAALVEQRLAYHETCHRWFTGGDWTRGYRLSAKGGRRRRRSTTNDNNDEEPPLAQEQETEELQINTDHDYQSFSVSVLPKPNSPTEKDATTGGVTIPSTAKDDTNKTSNDTNNDIPWKEIRHVWTVERGKDWHILQSLQHSRNALQWPKRNRPVPQQETQHQQPEQQQQQQDPALATNTKEKKPEQDTVSQPTQEQEQEQKEEEQPEPTMPASTPEPSSPSSSLSVAEFCHALQLLDEIHKDVIRTHADLSFFLHPHEHVGQRRQAALERILFVWSWHHDGCYVQGMNELVAVLYHVLCHDDHEESDGTPHDSSSYDWSSQAEADTHALLSRLLDPTHGVGSMYLADWSLQQQQQQQQESQPQEQAANQANDPTTTTPTKKESTTTTSSSQTVSPTTLLMSTPSPSFASTTTTTSSPTAAVGSGGIRQRLTALQDLLALHDPALSEHLHELGVTDASLYAVRWFTTLLSREFLLPDTIRLWDAMLASTHKDNFLRHVCLTLLLNVRTAVLQTATDFGTALQLLQHYPPLTATTCGSMDALLQSSRSLYWYETQITMACHKAHITPYEALLALPPPPRIQDSLIMAFGFAQGIVPQSTATSKSNSSKWGMQSARTWYQRNMAGLFRSGSSTLSATEEDGSASSAVAVAVAEEPNVNESDETQPKREEETFDSDDDDIYMQAILNTTTPTDTTDRTTTTSTATNPLVNTDLASALQGLED